MSLRRVQPLFAALPVTTPIVALIAAVALAAPAARAANPDPLAVPAGTYKVEASHTRILFAVSHMGFSTWYGDFSGASGTLVVDPARPQLDHVDISVPTASVTTTNAKLDGELKDPSWFDAAQFPTASFTSTAVTPTGPGAADIAGTLTLHGVSRPIVLHAHFNGGGRNMMTTAYTIGFDATAMIKRSDFGVKKYVPLIGDDVQLILSGAFEKTAG